MHKVPTAKSFSAVLSKIFFGFYVMLFYEPYKYLKESKNTYLNQITF